MVYLFLYYLLFAVFNLMLPFIHAHHHHHHHVTFQTAHLPPVTHSWIPKHRLWQRCLWIRPGDECPDKTSAVSKGKHTHTYTQTHILQYTTSIRKTKPKKKEQKKEVKHRHSPYCPQTPALQPSLPSAPLLCLQRSDQRAKRNKEEKRKRRSGGAKGMRSCRGKVRRRR